MARRINSVILFVLLAVISKAQSPCTAPLYSNSSQLYNSICGGIYYNPFNKIINGDSIKKYLIAVHKFDSAHGGGGADSAILNGYGLLKNISGTKITLRVDTSKLTTIFGLHDSLTTYVQRKDSNVKQGYATIYYVNSHVTNYLNDTVSGSGTKPTLLTKNSGAVNGGNKNGANLIIGTFDNFSLIFNVDNSNAGEINTSGQTNMGIGSSAGGNSATSYGTGSSAGGNNSTALGGDADAAGIGGVDIGWFSFETNNFGIAIGYQCRTAGLNSDYIGDNIASTGNYCSALGSYALENNTGIKNTSLGDSAGYHQTSGNYNLYLGHLAGGSNHSLSNQVYIGDTGSAADAPIAVKFSGALDPYYSSNYQAGTSGQILISKGSGVSPQWAAVVPTVNMTHTIFTPTTGTTVTLVRNQINIINPSGSLTTLTLAAPSSPSNNDIIIVIFTQTIATVTYSGLSGGFISPIVGTTETFTYDSGTTTWY